jgi:predicted nucleotide-binding protein
VTARRKPSPPEEKPLELLIPAAELREQIAGRIEKGKEILDIAIETWRALDTARDEYHTWSEYNQEMLRQATTNDDLSREYSWCPEWFSQKANPTLRDEIDALRQAIREENRRLGSISERLELIPVGVHASPAAASEPGSSPRRGKPFGRAPEGQREVAEGDPRKVLVVHGRNEAVRLAMFSFLRAIHLEPIEWTEAVAATGEGSPHVSTVLDVAFSMARAVVAVHTPDEEVRLREELQSPGDEPSDCFGYQARPNVLFEAGMAMGRCPKRTILVEIGKTRPFSDVGGRHVVRLDNNAKRRKELAQRLETAGCQVSIRGHDWLSVGDFEGPVQFAPRMSAETSEPATRCEDIHPVDAINMMEEWFRAAAERRKWGMVPVTFANVDQELGLPPGTAKKYLTEAADGCGYKAERLGPKTGTFKRVPAVVATDTGRWDRNRML